MRPVLLSVFAFLIGTGTVSAQQKVTDKAVIKTPAACCDVCKDKIEFFIKREYGVISVAVDMKKRTTTVAWITDRTDIETIKTAIANLGFDADDIEAEEYAYKRLPAECKKKPEVVKPVGGN